MLLSVRTFSPREYQLSPHIPDCFLSNRTKIEPWLRPALPELVDEVIAAVQSAVPAYRVLDRNVRTGVAQALEGFIELTDAGESRRLPGREVYVQFGRGEARNGRPLDALLGAYRVGAQTAWRGMAHAGERAGVEPRLMFELAEAIFAYIDEISAASAEGHAIEQSLAAREEQERRRRLVEALLADPQSPELERIAQEAGWELPGRIAVLAFDARATERVAARMPPPALITSGCGVIPDPDGPGRHDELRRALREARGALGPTVDIEDAAESARRARLALEVAGDSFTLADDHLLDLILAGDPRLAANLAQRRLAPLDELPKGQRERLVETLRAWLDAQGEARPAADRLHVHVQTVRYRLGQLRDVLGDSLDDPQARLELALALRIAG